MADASASARLCRSARASRPARSRRAALSHRRAREQGHGDASAGALAVPRRHRREGPQGVSLHQHRRHQGAALRFAGRDRRLCRHRRDLPHRHERGDARRDRPGLGARDRPSGAAARRHQAPCQEVVDDGRGARRTGPRASASLPIPISTPGFDAAPYLTATGVITRDPDSRVQNFGTYRGMLKAPTRLGMMMLANIRAGGLEHWRKYRARGEPMPVAIVVGCPPLVAFQGPQKLGSISTSWRRGRARRGPDQRRARPHRRSPRAGRGGAGDRGRSVDTDYLEPEGPFGESHGYVALEDYNTVVRGHRDHAAAGCDPDLDHLAGDAERIERGEAPGLRADVPRPSARPARHRRSSAASRCTSR